MNNASSMKRFLIVSFYKGLSKPQPPTGKILASTAQKCARKKTKIAAINSSTTEQTITYICFSVSSNSYKTANWDATTFHKSITIAHDQWSRQLVPLSPGKGKHTSPLHIPTRGGGGTEVKVTEVTAWRARLIPTKHVITLGQQWLNVIQLVIFITCSPLTPIFYEWANCLKGKTPSTMTVHFERLFRVNVNHAETLKCKRFRIGPLGVSLIAALRCGLYNRSYKRICLLWDSDSTFC